MRLSWFKPVFLATSFVVLLATAVQITLVNEVQAAPGGQGMGPACPPACPPSPVNCDANLVITPTQSLQFGSMVGTLAGTVVVGTTGLRTATGGVVLVTGAPVSAASFSMSTVPYNCNGRALPVITVGPTATLNHSTLPGVTMTVDTFVTNPVAGDAFDDTIPLTVGATLNVNAGQASGTYQGTYDVTVTFQ